ncbi:hypothetical protein V6S63_13550 [Lactococcus lactis]|uniref:hypothetical protein n=1 Tax=Lactococcus TaxID=1357 RepID=UPI00117BAD25|nr:MULTISPECIES: hypothetical protein [Lactococcus]MCT0455249.1 hypothetical protein [Lactococcus cremoris]MDM7537998.1 hypothetical protein [Lactococcus lactis]TRW66462.1 hypothetical protein FNJ58_14180 [Lactococcus lactis]
MNKKLKTSIVGSAIALVLTPIVFPSLTSVVQADQLKKESKVNSDTLSTEDLEVLLASGATLQEINQLPESDKTISNGMIVEGNNQMLRGKWSSAAKILLKNYNKLPSWVKGVIGYGTMNAIAKKLEQLSGNLTDALTIAIEAVGFSPGVARTIAKAIAYALF